MLDNTGNTSNTPNTSVSNATIADELIYGNVVAQQHASSQVSSGQQEDLDGYHRVVSTRYKVYIVIFLLVAWLVFSKMILPAWDKKQQVDTAMQNKQQEIASFQSKKDFAKKNVLLLKTMELNGDAIVQCINDAQRCSWLDNKALLFSWENKNLVRSYLNLGSLENAKMRIDEKKILENLNDFLLRKDINVSVYNGEINAIHIWEEEKFDSHIYMSPIDLEIIFENKDDLLSFVDNIELKIVPDQSKRILYQIENIKYDILKSHEKQAVDISLYMFYTR